MIINEDLHPKHNTQFQKNKIQGRNLSVMDAHEGSLMTGKPASISLKESVGKPYVGSWRF